MLINLNAIKIEEDNVFIYLFFAFLPTKNAGEPTVSRPLLLNEGDTELSTTTTIMIDNETSSVFHFGPKDIMPFPKTTKTKRANVKRGKTAIITSSPYRLELKASQNKQAEKIKKTLIFQKDMKPTKKEAKKSSGGWVQCPKCRLWAHCLCAGVEDEDEETLFLCEKCAD
ncbi:hypothetical protein ACJJTC_010735 [Scirpophaga incertulas]